MNITLSDEQWKKFEEIMQSQPREPSEKLKEAARRLDEEGLTFNISNYRKSNDE